MSQQSKVPFLITLLGTLAFFWPALSAAQITPSDAQIQVDRALVEHNLVGLGVAVYTPDLDEPIVVVAGERKRGSDDMITASDAWHIGSNTKMLTALSYAKLVERGDAKWGATLPELFPDLVEIMHPDWQDITIEDLLSHRSGMEPNPDPVWMIARTFDSKELNAQRAEFAQKVLTSAAKGKKGEFSYSNTGYMIAGAVIENLDVDETDESFETLLLSMFDEDFKKIGGAIGFGPPKSGIQGHRKGLFGNKLNSVGYSGQADNPAIFGPAGTMHIDLRTHVLFLAKHFISGDNTIKEKLLKPYPNSESDYALGWGIGNIEGIGQVYGHNGSNTMWLSNVTYAPSLEAIVIVNTNQFNTDARTAVREIAADILTQISDTK
jgi:CubicO group peptidase (beta-lactamase class C family)